MASSAVPGAAATTTPTLIPPNDVLRLGIDLGTSGIRVCAQHIHGAHTQESAAIIVVHLKEGQDATLQQIVILLEDGTVVYGANDVNRAVEQNPSLERKIMLRPKLAVHPGFGHLDDVQHTWKTVHRGNTADCEEDRGAMQDLFADIFRAVFKDARASFPGSDFSAGKSSDYWNAIPLEVEISVPAMWNYRQRGDIRNAAKLALSCSDPRVEIREEALCVATYYLSKMLDVEVGNRYTFGDVGDGTWDITTVEVVRAHSRNAPMQLRRVSLCSGNGAGANMVNAEARAWLLRDKPLFEKNCRQLRITERECSRQFSDEIDRIKTGFDKSRGLPQKATIYSSHGKLGPDMKPEWVIHIPHDTIVQWYDTWTNAAEQLLADHLAKTSLERHESATLTGGGSNSNKFCERMNATFAKYGIKGKGRAHSTACAKGSLMYHYFQEDKLPVLAYFYVATKVHRDQIREDAEEEQREQEQEGGGTFDPSNEGPKKGKKDRSGAKPRSKRPWSEDDADLKEDKEDTYLPDRTKIIGCYSYGSLTRMEPVRMLFHVNANSKRLGRIHADLFRSKHRFAEHTPLTTEADELISGVHGYPLMFADLDDLKAQSFEVHDGDDNTNTPPYFELKAFVEMTGTSEKLLLTLHVMKPDYEFPHELDDAYAAVNENDRLFEHTQEVWSKGCSHFTSNTTGTCSSSGEDPAEAVPSTREVRQRRCKR